MLCHKRQRRDDLLCEGAATLPYKDEDYCSDSSHGSQQSISQASINGDATAPSADDCRSIGLVVQLWLLPGLQCFHQSNQPLNGQVKYIDNSFPANCGTELRREEDRQTPRDEDEARLVDDEALEDAETPREYQGLPTCICGHLGPEKLATVESECQQEPKEDAQVGSPAKDNSSHRRPIAICDGSRQRLPQHMLAEAGVRKVPHRCIGNTRDRPPQEAGEMATG